MKAIVLVALTLMAGCCSVAKYEDMRERAQTAEALVVEQQKFVAGVQDDNAMLQKYGIALQQESQAWQMGAAMQAEELAKARANCEI